MPIVGSADIYIRALDKHFVRDIENAVKKIKDVGVGVTVDADISPAQKQVEEFRKELKANPVQVAIKADVKSFGESISKVTSKVKPVKVSVVADTVLFRKSITELNDKIKNAKVKVPVYAAPVYFKRDIDAFVKKMKLNPVKLEVKIDSSSAQKAINNIQAQTQTTIPLNLNTQPAQQQAQAAATAIGASTSATVPVNANTNTAKAEAQLAFLTRLRKVKIVADIEKSAMNSLRGVVEALAGVVPPRQVADAIEGILSNFSALAVSRGAIVGALGAIGAAGTALGGVLLTVGSDVGNLVGLLATAPAGMLAMQMGMKTLTYAFEGFGAAVSKGGPDLEKLVPAARAAAEAMHNVVKSMKQDVQETFWERAGDSMVEFADDVMPHYARNMEGLADSFGTAFGDMLDAVHAFQEGGRLENTLDNITSGLGFASDGAGAFTEALLTLTGRGSESVRDFGKYVRGLAESFNFFIQEAERTGQIQQWIDDAVQAVQNLASITKSIVVVFGNLSEAARDAGFGGLQALADALDAVEEASNDVLAMARITEIFKGAKTGALDLTTGLRILGDTFMESAGYIREFLELGGSIGKVFAENLDVLLNADGFAEGILRAMEGFRNGLDEATPGFESLGAVIGDVGEIAGTLFEVMAPGFNNLMTTIENVVAGIKDGFIAALPVVNQFVDMLMQLARGPLTLVAQGVGKLLELFSALPTPLQNTVLAVLALNTALKTLAISGGAISLLGGKFDNLGKRAAGSKGLVSGLGAAMVGIAGAGAGAGKAVGGLSQKAQAAGAVASTTSGQIKGLGTAAAGMATGMAAGATGAKNTGTAIGGIAKSAGGAGGALSRIGGIALGATRAYLPLAAVVTAVTSAFAVYQNSAGYTAASTNELSTAMQQYGITSREALSTSEAMLTNSATVGEAFKKQITSLGGLRDVTNTAAEGYKELGWNVDEMALSIHESGDEATDYESKLRALYKTTEGLSETQGKYTTSTSNMGKVTREASQAILGTADAAGLTRAQLKEMLNSYQTVNEAVEEHIQKQVRAQEAARKQAQFQAEVSTEVGKILTPELLNAASAYSVLGDATSSIADKTAAWNTTMAYTQQHFRQTANDTLLTADSYMVETQAKMASAQASADLDVALQGMRDSFSGLDAQLVSATGGFIENSQEARNFYYASEEVSNGIKNIGIAAYQHALDTGKSTEVAANTARDKMMPMINNLKDTWRALGITNEDTINQMLSSIGLLPEDIPISLNAHGDAQMKIQETAAMATALDAGNYDIALAAVNHEALGVIADTVGAGKAFATGDYEAVFKAMVEEYGLSETIELLEGVAGEDFDTTLTTYAKDLAGPVISGTLEKAGHLDGTSVEAQLGVIDELSFPIDQSLMKLAEVDGQSPEAELKAIDNLSWTVKDALAQVLNLDNTESETIMNALDNASPEIRLALGLSDEADGKTATIQLDALDNASKKTVGAIDMAVGFDGTKATATLEALDNLSPTARKALAEVLGIDKTEGYALLAAIDELSPTAAKALEGIDGIDGMTASATLTAIDQATPSTLSALGSIGQLDGKTAQARLDALDNASHKARTAMAEVLGINSAEGYALLDAYNNADPKVQDALNKVMEFDNADAMATLQGDDQFSPVAAQAGFSLDSFNSKPSNKSIIAQDHASYVIENANSSLAGFVSAPATKGVYAEDHTGMGVAAAQGTMSSLQDVMRQLTAQNNTGTPVAGAQATMNSLHDVMRQLQATDSTGAPTASAQGTMNSLQDVLRQLKANNATGPQKAAAQATMNSLEDVLRMLEAQDNTPGPTSNAKRNMNSVNDRNVNINVSSNASSVVEGVRGALASLRDRVVNIFTRRSGDNAVGGIYTTAGEIAYANGGIQKAEAYANGGIRLPKSVTSFASGSENHVAQISRGQWPVRIWSEPETGGEAYIPLGLSKRDRSTEILKKVAEMFGFSLVKKFADGGILSGLPQSKTGHFADGGFNTTRNMSGYITNNNSTASRSEVVHTSGAGNVTYAPVMNVYPSAQLNEEQVAESVARDLFWKILHS